MCAHIYACMPRMHICHLTCMYTPMPQIAAKQLQPGLDHREHFLTATHCNTLQHTATRSRKLVHWKCTDFGECVAMCCSVLQRECVAMCCSVLQRECVSGHHALVLETVTFRNVLRMRWFWKLCIIVYHCVSLCIIVYHFQKSAQHTNCFLESSGSRTRPMEPRGGRPRLTRSGMNLKHF